MTPAPDAGRSHVDRTIVLLEMGGNYVPVAEVGCHLVEDASAAAVASEPERVVEV